MKWIQFRSWLKPSGANVSTFFIYNDLASIVTKSELNGTEKLFTLLNIIYI